MAFDGIMLNSIKNELSRLLLGAKVDKITQPEKDEVILQLRKNNNYRLLLTANPSQPRVHLTEINKENPLTPPNFCMLLRKHLTSGKLIEIKQPSFERVLIFTFECQTELYETVKKNLIIEIMGRYSNIIFTDENQIIYDAVRQIDFTTSTVRQILPGLKYEFPPSQNKKELSENLVSEDMDFSSELRLDKYLTETFIGFSPLISREIAYLSTGSTDVRLLNMRESQRDKLIFYLKKLNKNIINEDYKPEILISNKLLEFYCFDILQYGTGAITKPYETCSAVVDEFYKEKDKQEHIKRNSTDILKVITTVTSRLSRKIEAQRGELVECEKADKYKKYGDLLTANLYKLSGRDDKVVLTDYYSENSDEIEIPLNTLYTPIKNAQNYFRLYKKAQTAKRYLNEQIPLALSELDYLNSIFESLVRADNLTDLAEIRRELISEHYIKLKNKPIKPRKETLCKPMTFKSSDGFIIYAGKNNLQNDYITLRLADKKDIWFHVKDYPGCHVVVVTNETIPPDSTLTEAATIAATYSKANDGKNIAVDYTWVKNVKKPSGNKPGMVIYDNNKTAYVSPDAEMTSKLKI